MINMISETEFTTISRGHEMTLKKEILGGDSVWAMYTVNAAVRAHNRGFAIPKYFDSLTEVEGKYKSWNGISTLADAA